MSGEEAAQFAAYHNMQAPHNGAYAPPSYAGDASYAGEEGTVPLFRNRSVGVPKEQGPLFRDRCVPCTHQPPRDSRCMRGVLVLGGVGRIAINGRMLILVSCHGLLKYSCLPIPGHKMLVCSVCVLRVSVPLSYWRAR